MSKFERVLSDDDIEELYLRSDMFGGEIYFSSLVAEIEQAVLQSPEIQALRKDAVRYRWLRDGGNDDIGVVAGFECVDVGSTGVIDTYREGLEAEQLDKAIDAAMGKQAEQHDPAAMEWYWRMDWLRHNGFNPADPFLWERSGQEYAKQMRGGTSPMI